MMISLANTQSSSQRFPVTLNFSKMYHSDAPSEIFGQNGTFSIPTITDISSVRFWDPRKKSAEELATEKEKLNLKEEAEEHARIIREADIQAMKRWEAHSKDVLKITESVRKDNGLLFPPER